MPFEEPTLQHFLEWWNQTIGQMMTHRLAARSLAELFTKAPKDSTYNLSHLVSFKTHICALEGVLRDSVDYRPWCSSEQGKQIQDITKDHENLASHFAVLYTEMRKTISMSPHMEHLSEKGKEELRRAIETDWDPTAFFDSSHAGKNVNDEIQAVLDDIGPPPATLDMSGFDHWMTAYTCYHLNDGDAGVAPGSDYGDAWTELLQSCRHSRRITFSFRGSCFRPEAVLHDTMGS